MIDEEWTDLTPSFDMETKVDKTFETSHISKENLEEAAQKFTGEIDQIPPVFSALKKDGKRRCLPETGDSGTSSIITQSVEREYGAKDYHAGSSMVCHFVWMVRDCSLDPRDVQAKRCRFSVTIFGYVCCGNCKLTWEC